MSSSLCYRVGGSDIVKNCEIRKTFHSRSLKDKAALSENFVTDQALDVQFHPRTLPRSSAYYRAEDTFESSTALCGFAEDRYYGSKCANLRSREDKSADFCGLAAAYLLLSLSSLPSLPDLPTTTAVRCAKAARALFAPKTAAEDLYPLVISPMVH